MQLALRAGRRALLQGQSIVAARVDRSRRFASSGFFGSGPYVRWKDNIATSLSPTIFDAKTRPESLPLLHDLVQERFDEFGTDVAIIDGTTGETRNYQELSYDRDAIASVLQSMELSPNEVVGILSPNHCDFYAAITGPLRAGLSVTPLNTMSTAAEIAKQLQSSNARLVFTHISHLEKAEAAAKSAGCVQDIILLGDRDSGGRVCLRSLAKANAAKPHPISISNDQTALLPYSSGTTGLPKGTMLSHANLAANLLQGNAMLSQNDRSRGAKVLSPLPMYHIYALMTSMLGNVWKGVPLVTMQSFDFPRFLELIQQHRCTRLHVVPPIALGLAKLPLVSEYDVSSCRTAMCAAAPLATEVQQAVAERLGIVIKQGWGMTELSPLATIELDCHPHRPGSVGPPCASTAIKVVDLESGKALPAGSDGELCVKGPQVMKGYLNEPQKTAECRTTDGWLHTGDIARIDEDGFVFITDRLKELIKYKGFQVAPAELEGLICTHPAVQDVAVIPKADATAGEIPRAYVVLKPGVKAGDDVSKSIEDFVAERAAPTKKLRGGVVFTDCIPKTASGKILRREIIRLDRGGD